MKKILVNFFFIFFFINTLNLAHGKIENKIILKIENKIVTNYEYKNKILTTIFLAREKPDQSKIDVLKERALQSLIEYKIKDLELSKYDIKEDAIQIQNYLNGISKNDINNFKAEFKKNNLDYELFYNEVSTELKWQKLIYQMFANKINIDEKIIEKDLKEIIDKRPNITEYRISEIELPLDKESKNIENIIDIKSKIKNEGFENTAIKYSIALSSSNKGDLGWVNENSLSPEIKIALKKLKINQVSEPIIQKDRILFLKLTGKKNNKSENIDKLDLKNRLINRKKNELFNLYSKSYLSKLKNSYLIEYK